MQSRHVGRCSHPLTYEQILTSVVFDPDVYFCINEIGRYCYGFLCVDVDVLMFRWVVGCARGNAQHVLLMVRH